MCTSIFPGSAPTEHGRAHEATPPLPPPLRSSPVLSGASDLLRPHPLPAAAVVQGCGGHLWSASKQPLLPPPFSTPLHPSSFSSGLLPVCIHVQYMYVPTGVHACNYMYCTCTCAAYRPAHVQFTYCLVQAHVLYTHVPVSSLLSLWCTGVYMYVYCTCKLS